FTLDLGVSNDFDSNVVFTANKVELKGDVIPSLSLPANVSIKTTGITNPKIFKNGAECTACLIKSFNPATGEITFSTG
ncbi:hypothetical protein HY993_05075, partial [Candidatus Micrarchaeota archaeon]|nr:hypothetical protein [Candidatus Micrarchaeota archaeon]